METFITFVCIVSFFSAFVITVVSVSMIFIVKYVLRNIGFVDSGNTPFIFPRQKPKEEGNSKDAKNDTFWQPNN